MSNAHRYALIQEELSCLLLEEAEPALAEDMNMGDEVFVHLLIDEPEAEAEAEEDSAI